MTFDLSAISTSRRPFLTAKSKAARTIRSTPLRVWSSSCTAISSGVPFLKLPPTLTYAPSVFSRKTTKSMSFSVFPLSGQRRAS